MVLVCLLVGFCSSLIRSLGWFSPCQAFRVISELSLKWTGPVHQLPEFGCVPAARQVHQFPVLWSETDDNQNEHVSKAQSWIFSSAPKLLNEKCSSRMELFFTAFGFWGSLRWRNLLRKCEIWLCYQCDRNRSQDYYRQRLCHFCMCVYIWKVAEERCCL